MESLRLPEIVLKRLVALAEARGVTPAELAIEALREFTSSAKARRAIRKARKGFSLADLGWMDGYEGETVDEVLSFAGTENASVVLVSLAALIERHWIEHPTQRTGVENDVVAVTASIREVHNGGFDQFFRNASKQWAFFVASSLLRIGRADAARLVRRAVRAIGQISGSQSGPGRGTAFEELDQKMSLPDPRRDDVFSECNQEFYQLTGLAESLLAYAQRYADGIVR